MFGESHVHVGGMQPGKRDLAQGAFVDARGNEPRRWCPPGPTVICLPGTSCPPLRTVLVTVSVTLVPAPFVRRTGRSYCSLLTNSSRSGSFRGKLARLTLPASPSLPLVWVSASITAGALSPPLARTSFRAGTNSR